MPPFQSPTDDKPLPLRPNLDRRGRALRAILGLLLAAGTILVVFTASGGRRWIGILILGGASAFVLFEAAAGWCAARACGLRTRV
jgi:hypothetical protein